MLGTFGFEASRRWIRSKSSLYALFPWRGFSIWKVYALCLREVAKAIPSGLRKIDTHASPVVPLQKLEITGRHLTLAEVLRKVRAQRSIV